MATLPHLPFQCRIGHQALFSASLSDTSVFGQKCDKSPTGKLTGNLISAAIMTKVIYHPNAATINNNAPPVWTRRQLSLIMPRTFSATATNLLQLPSKSIIPTPNLEVRSSKHPRHNRHEKENSGEDRVGFEGEDEEGEERETPDDKV